MRHIHCAAYIPLIFAAALGFFFVGYYGVNMVFWDEWTMPVLCTHCADGTLSFSDFWSRHNENHLVFPKLVLLAAWALTRGDVVACMMLSECMLAAILCIFVVEYKRRFGGGLILWAATPIALLVFSFRQWENMLWGFHVVFLMTTLASILTFWWLSRLSIHYKSALVAAVVSATVAAYSLTQGLLAWPVGLAQILIGPLDKQRKLYAALLWGVIGILEWAAYFYNYTRPPYHPPLMTSLPFLFALFGGALFGTQTAAIWTGLFFVCIATGLVLMLHRHQQWKQNSFWLAVMGMSVATSLIIMLGRTGFGLQQSLSSRYSTFSIPFIVATYVLLMPQKQDFLLKVRWSLTCVLAVVVFAGLWSSAKEGIRMGQVSSESRLYGQAALHTTDLQFEPVLLQVCHPDKTVLLDCNEKLKRLNFNIYSDDGFREQCRCPLMPLPVSQVPARYAISHLHSTIGEWLPPTYFAVRGWAADAGGVAVVFDGVAHPARYGIQNPDAPDTKSGFICLLRAKDFSVGKHKVSLRVVTSDRQAVFETPEEVFEIRR
jgi:hypothetical protein